jgi:hypothetical protein
MAEIKKLGSTVQINGEDYEVMAKVAENADVASRLNSFLTVVVNENGQKTTTEFDGSSNKTVTIDIPTGGSGGEGGASISHGTADPSGDTTTQYYFKYN